MQTIIVNKFIIGAMALFVMLGFNSLWFKSNNIDAKIYNYNNGRFYGELIVKDRKLPLIVSVNADVNNGSNSNEKTYNENKNYNENKEYTEYKENIDKKEINDNKQYGENKQYNEQKNHNISNNINKKEEIINKDDINKRENINKKEEKFNENIKITDDYTPGSIDIFIENNGSKVVIKRDIGSSRMSDIDEKCYEKIIDGVIKYIENDTNKKISSKVIDLVKGFKNYITKPKNGRLFKW